MKINQDIMKSIVKENCKFYSDVTFYCFKEFCIEELQMNNKASCTQEEYFEMFGRFKEQFFENFMFLMSCCFSEFVEEQEEGLSNDIYFKNFSTMTQEDEDYLDNKAESTDGYNPEILQSNDFLLFLYNFKNELIESL